MGETYFGYLVTVVAITGDVVDFVPVGSPAVYQVAWPAGQAVQETGERVHADEPTTVARRAGSYGWMFLRGGEAMLATRPGTYVPVPDSQQEFCQQPYWLMPVNVLAGGEIPTLEFEASLEMFRVRWQDSLVVFTGRPTSVPCDPRGNPMEGHSGLVALSQEFCAISHLDTGGGSKWPISLGAGGRHKGVVISSLRQAATMPEAEFDDEDKLQRGGDRWVRVKVQYAKFPRAHLKYRQFSTKTSVELRPGQQVHDPVVGSVYKIALAGEYFSVTAADNASGWAYVLQGWARSVLEAV